MTDCHRMTEQHIAINMPDRLAQQAHTENGEERLLAWARRAVGVPPEVRVMLLDIRHIAPQSLWFLPPFLQSGPDKPHPQMTTKRTVTAT
jgi:hypothetical protein